MDACNGILDWIATNRIKNEKGDLIEFDNHPFLIDIYDDQATLLAVMKAAQIGMTTLEFIKMFYDAMRFKMDIIYSLPTDSAVRILVGGKFNRIIANNPIMLKYVADKDSIEQKQVGKSMIYFRGSWTKKDAIMVTADRLCHDEKDASKLDVIADFQARLQHSKFKQTHTFSHPNLPETGVHADWLNSDQKHWFIQCPHCKKWQYMSWDVENPENMSVDLVRLVYICKKCRKELPDWVRISGQWVAKYPDIKWSGYWVPLLIAPWMSARELVAKYNHPDTTDEFFYTKILGLPYADGSSKLLRDSFFQNLTGKSYAPNEEERVIIGVDPGKNIDYVIGNQYGLFFHGDAQDFGELDMLMKRWPRAIAVCDGGGELLKTRAFQERWKGRVFLCYLTGDRKKNEIVSWGRKDEHGSCIADRNRMIQLVVDEFRNKRIPVHGTEDDWFSYWTDWNHLSKIKILDPDTNVLKCCKWVRSGRDHLCFVAGTKIITSTGEKDIQDIKVGDRVLTRNGLKKVVWKDDYLADVIDTGLLVGTPDHPIWTENDNFKDLHAIVFSDILLVCKKKKSFIKILSFVDTLIQRIEQKEFILSQMGKRKQMELGDYTKKFTETILVLSRKTLSFIIKILIRLITHQKTWKQYQEQNIQDYITKNGCLKKKIEKQTENILKKYVQKVLENLQSGKKHQRVKEHYDKTLIYSNGSNAVCAEKKQQQHHETEENSVVNNVIINYTIKNGEQDTQNINSLKQYVQYAGKSLKEVNMGEGKLAQKNAQTHKLAGRKRVYNFEVEDDHEYFANGILVSNCLATVFFRVGMMKFAGMGHIVEATTDMPIFRIPMIKAGSTIMTDLDKKYFQGIEDSLDRLEEEEIEW